MKSQQWRLQVAHRSHSPRLRHRLGGYEINIVQSGFETFCKQGFIVPRPDQFTSQYECPFILIQNNVSCFCDRFRRITEKERVPSRILSERSKNVSVSQNPLAKVGSWKIETIHGLLGLCVGQTLLGRQDDLSKWTCKTTRELIPLEDPMFGELQTSSAIDNLALGGKVIKSDRPSMTPRSATMP